MTGEFYKRLIVGVPTNFPQYYELVRQVLEEAETNFPTKLQLNEGNWNWVGWFRRWFGSEFKEKGEEDE